MMTKKSFFVCLGLFWTVVQAALATPTLRLTIPESLRLQNGEVRPVWIASGTNGPSNLLFEAWNSGDGNLNLQVSGGADAWLKPSISGTQPCSSNSATSCTLIRVLFDSAGLPNGSYEGEVWVQDPNALDAPQSVPIKIYVGGDVPERVDLFLRPAAGSTDFVEFQTPEPANRQQPTRFTAQGDFLSVSSSGNGSFQFVYTHRISASYRPGMAAGENTGAATVTGSGFQRDNRTFPARLRVTDDPIIQLNAPSLRFETAQEIDALDLVLVVSNRGNGTLAVTAVEADTASGGDWLSVAESQALAGQANQAAGTRSYIVSADQEGLAAGRYTGTITIAANAANAPIAVPVILDVSAQGPPQISYRGVVNGATFSQNQPLAPGAIVSVFGSQLAYDTDQASSVPLPTELASAKVTVGGIDAPLFFASRGQINFQVPYEVSTGPTTVQVSRDGQPGNRVTATVSERTSGIFRLNIGEYGAILNASQGNNFPLPGDMGTALGIAAAPARPGDVLTIFTTGLGPVSPVVATGQAAPAEGPVSYGVGQPTVNFGRPIPVRQEPMFVGLAPGFVGLYQVNVAVPDDSPTNARTAVTLEYPGSGSSNTVEIAVER